MSSISDNQLLKLAAAVDFEQPVNDVVSITHTITANNVPVMEEFEWQKDSKGNYEREDRRGNVDAYLGWVRRAFCQWPHPVIVAKASRDFLTILYPTLLR